MNRHHRLAIHDLRGDPLWLLIPALLGFMLLVTILPGLAGAADLTTSPTTAQLRPNILLIVTDDQRADTLDALPLSMARLMDAGVDFANAYGAAPVCCPARASLLAGTFPSRHGVTNNSADWIEGTPHIFQLANSAGYYTVHVGNKWLNSWDGSMRQEYNYWFTKPGTSCGCSSPKPYNWNGTWVGVAGYPTYVYRDKMIDALNKVPVNVPFMAQLNFNIPHEPATPTAEDSQLYPNLPLHRPPSHNEADISDKPAWLRVALLSADKIRAIDDLRKKQYQSLASVDRSVVAILDKLVAQGKLSNTIVIFTSDNGYLWGEHRLDKKERPYEEVIRVPVVVRSPLHVTTPRKDHHLVSHLDITATMAELAGVVIPNAQGRSLISLLANPSVSWREDLRVESRGRYFDTLRYQNWVYTEKPNQIPELYDLAADPYQLQNLSQRPEYRALMQNMHNRLFDGVE